jgi:hypothetical protein
MCQIMLRELFMVRFLRIMQSLSLATHIIILAHTRGSDSD